MGRMEGFLSSVSGSIRTRATSIAMRARAMASQKAPGRTQKAGGRQEKDVTPAVAKPEPTTRREVTLNASALLLGSVFTIGRAPRPEGIGVRDYGGGVRALGLCPKSPNCISTAEEMNDPAHFVPPWDYNPEEGRGRTGPVTQKQAMEELVEVVKNTKPDKFEPNIVKQTDDYLYVEYASPLLGFVDDVEFWFPGNGSRVEYRSASRIGESDGDINRKRIKALRLALQEKGWVSVGF